MTLDPLQPSGTINLRQLETLHWAATDHRMSQAREAQKRWDPTHLVARSFDQAQPGGHRVEFQVASLLSSAEENIQAFRSLISSFGIRHWAHWNLLRPNLEASLWSLWILEPASSRDRVIRALRLEIDDAREQWKWLVALGPAGLPDDALTAARSTFTSTEQAYKQQANDLRISWKEVTAYINFTKLVPSLPFGSQYDSGFGHYVCSIWRRLSGALHTKPYSLLARADRGHRIRIPGGESVHLTVNDDDFISTCKVVNAVHLAAIERYIQWTTSTQPLA